MKKKLTISSFLFVLCGFVIVPSWAQWVSPAASPPIQKPIHLIIKGYDPNIFPSAFGESVEQSLQDMGQEILMVGDFVTPVEMQDIAQATKAIASTGKPMVVWTVIHGLTLGGDHYLNLGDQDVRTFIKKHISDQQQDQQYKIMITRNEKKSGFWEEKLDLKFGQKLDGQSAKSAIEKMVAWHTSIFSEETHRKDFIDPYDQRFSMYLEYGNKQFKVPFEKRVKTSDLLYTLWKNYRNADQSLAPYSIMGVSCNMSTALRHITGTANVAEAICRV